MFETSLDHAYWMALRQTGDPDFAQEVVQETYSRFSRRPPPPMDSAQARVYLYRAVRHTALELRRTGAIRRKHEEAYAKRALSDAPAADEVVAGREAALSARQALSDLPEDERQAVSLCCEMGLSWQQASEVLEIPRQTLGYRVQKGLERLRVLLAAQGFTAVSGAGIGAALQGLEIPAAPASLALFVKTLGLSATSAAGGAQAGVSLAAAGKAAPVIQAGMLLKVTAAVLLAGAAGSGAYRYLARPVAAPGKLESAAPVASQPQPPPKPAAHYLLNGGFDLDANKDGRPDHWETGTSEYVKQELSIDAGPEGLGKSARLHCPSFTHPEDPISHVLLRQDDAPALPAGRYRLSFLARQVGIAGGNVSASVLDGKDYALLGSFPLQLNTQWKACSCEFENARDLPPGRASYRFHFLTTGTLWVASLQVERIEGSK